MSRCDGRFPCSTCGPVMNGAFFIVSGMPRVLEIIFPMPYHDGGLIQTNPGRSMPGEDIQNEKKPLPRAN